MNNFSDFMKDTITLLKADGTKFADLKASVQKNKIIMFNSSVLVESGDLIQRRMSNGGEETYRVIDPQFHETFHSIKAHYQMEVEKLGIPEANKAVQSITYNINGNNARINQNSVDASTNVVKIDNRVLEQLAALRAEINQLPEEQKIDAAEVIDTIEAQFNSGNPKKSVVSALLTSLPHIESISSIAGNILSLFS